MPRIPVARKAGSAPVETRRRPAPRVLVLLLLPMLALILFQPSPRQEPAEFIRVEPGKSVPGEIVVRFRDGVPRAAWPAIASTAGATLDREMLLDGFAKLKVPEGREDAVGAALTADPRVRSAEEVAYRHLMFVPNDEYFGDQWNLSLIQMERAWDLSTGTNGAGGSGSGGDGVVVAVLDSGVAYEDYDDPDGTHYRRAPDLAGTKFIAPFDAFGNDAHPNDDNGHGTHIAGTIAQATNNAIGVAGIAFNAQIMPVKVCGDLDGNYEDDRDYTCPDDAVAEGIIYAVNNGARVINLSLGGETPLGAGSLHRQAIEYAHAANVVVVAAAGNGSGNPRVGRPFLAYPAAIASVISVGAAGSGGQKASYSDYGLGEEGNTMDLVAPGGDAPPGKYIRQNTYAHVCSGPQTPRNFTLFGYCDMIGSSQATAHVTGVVALIRSKYPDLSAPQVRADLDCSALDVGQPGVDLQHGNGLVQAFWALMDSDGDGLPNCLDPEAGVSCLAPHAPPTPQPTPVETTAPTETAAAPTPTATAIPGTTPTPIPFGAPAGVPATDTPTPVPTDTPPPPTDTPIPTDTPTPVPTDTPTPVPPTDTATPLPTDAPASTPEPTPTETPLPTDTPTPVPTPATPSCGDVDCDLDLDAVDALFILRRVAALLPVATCIDYGDVDCDGGIDAVDGLGVLRKIAGLSVTRVPGCPQMGYGS